MIYAPEYSVVVPVYNGAATLYHLCKELEQVMTAHDHEIILVDDGSLDSSWECIKEMSALYSTVKGIRLQQNYGQHPATLCGLEHSSGTFCITMDDDMQHDPYYIPAMIRTRTEYNADVVYASFVKTKRTFFRSMTSTLFRWNARLLGYLPNASSFRLITRKMVTCLMEDKGRSLFIDALLPRYTSSIAFVNVVHRKRMQGRSGYVFSKLLGLYINIAGHYMLPLKRKINAHIPLYTVISRTDDISERTY